MGISVTRFSPEQFTDHRLCCLQYQSATTIALLVAVDSPAPVGSQCSTAASVPQAVMVAQPWSRHSNSESRVWRLGSVPASTAQPQRVHSLEAAEIVTPPKPPLCLPASASSGRGCAGVQPDGGNRASALLSPDPRHTLGLVRASAAGGIPPRGRCWRMGRWEDGPRPQYKS